MAFSCGKLVHEHPLAIGLQLWLPGLRPYAGGGRWLNIARPYNDGTATGTVNWGNNYRQGMAFRGNGTNAYYAVDATGLTDLPSTGMAIACAVRWTDTTVGQCAVAWGRSSTSTPLFLLGNGATSGAKARFSWRNDTNSATSHESSASFNDGLWHRFFFWRSTTSGGTYRFSVDGQSLSSSTLGTNPITFDRIAVGALVRNTVGSYWTGDVSDVMIWRTLTVSNKPVDELEMMRWDYEEWSKGWPELLNRRRRPLVFLPTGGSTYTASAAVTAGAATSSGSATFAAGTKTATAAATSGAATASGTATFAAGTKTASASVTAGAATCSASATFAGGTKTATATVSSGAATASGSATFTAPAYTASATVQAAPATASGTAIFATVVYQGSAVVSAGHATASGSATFTAPVYTSSASVSSAPATASGSATFVAPANRTASGAVTAGAATASGAGTFAAPVYTGTAGVTVPAAVVSGSGLFSVTGIFNALAAVSVAPATTTVLATYTNSTPVTSISGISIANSTTISGMSIETTTISGLIVGAG